MLYESPQLQVSADDGVATLGMAFAGMPLNGLDLARLAELERGLDAVFAEPGIEILVLRSLLPGGFCAGFTSHALSELIDDTSASQFASMGQRILAKLAESPVVSVAFVHGPCIGPGLELALACDYRLGLSGPDSTIGFGDTPTGWGGATRSEYLLGRRRTRRLNQLPPLTAREAVQLGLFDCAFSARRAKIELRTWLDRLQFRTRKRYMSKLATQFAAERAAFVDAMRTFVPPPEVTTLPETINPIPPFPNLVELIGNEPKFAWLAVEVALRDKRVIFVNDRPDVIEPFLGEAVRRGRATPLEANQARQRISLVTAMGESDCSGSPRPLERGARGEWVLSICDSAEAAILIEADLPPLALLGVPLEDLPEVIASASRPTRIFGITIAATITIHRADETTADTIASATTWFRALGMTVDVETIQSTSLEISPHCLLAE